MSQAVELFRSVRAVSGLRWIATARQLLAVNDQGEVTRQFPLHHLSRVSSFGGWGLWWAGTRFFAGDHHPVVTCGPSRYTSEEVVYFKRRKDARALAAAIINAKEFNQAAGRGP